MLRKKITKKGEITTSTLVSVILIIISFAILLFVYSQLDWSGNVNREVCHQSVVLRGTVPSLLGLKEGVPLKCTTEKFCITNKLFGKGECDEFKGLDNVHKVYVNNKADIEKFIIRDMIDCWKTMGEGKLSLFSDWVRDTWGIGEEAYPTCVICSRIAFDKESLDKAKIHLEELNVRDYSMRHAMPNSDESYYSYLAGERGKISFNDYLEIKDPVKQQLITEVDWGEIESKTQYVDISQIQKSIPVDSELSTLFMQISSPKLEDVLQNDLKTAELSLLGSFISAPTLTGTSLKALLSPTAGIVAIAAVAIFGVYQAGSVVYNQAITAGYCGDVSIGGQASQGCSVIRLTNYNKDSLGQYCQVIESIP